MGNKKGDIIMKFWVLRKADCEQVRIWRNEQLEILRTSVPLTEEMQEDFYYNVVCDRNANARYWGVVEDGNHFRNKSVDGATVTGYNDALIGMCGIENISWENRNGEMSILFAPDRWDTFEPAIEELLNRGFNFLNLENLYTETYFCNKHLSRWHNFTDKFHDDDGWIRMVTTLADRKYWNGQYHNSLYINFNREDYIKNEGAAAQPK
ncbi:MAG: hypothetical protein PHO15_00325 [Eubacteriales bacterium]|nr:hypothetical protein [Eubacteriales bacterium]